MKNRSRLVILFAALSLILACAPKVTVRKPASDYSKMDKTSVRP